MSPRGGVGEIAAGTPLAFAVVPGDGVALAWRDGTEVVATPDPSRVIADIATRNPRWVWWSARSDIAALVAAGVALRTCWDLAAVGRLHHGLRRGDPAAVWAAGHDLPEPPAPRTEPDLFDVATGDSGPVRRDGQLSSEWVRDRALADLPGALEWARTALALQSVQQRRIDALPDPRVASRPPSLGLLTAYAESAAARLAIELEHTGLPIDREAAAALLEDLIGQRPASPDDEAVARRARAADVLRQFPAGPDVDLRSPAQVRGLLTRIGLDLPDTRSWRLEPHAATSPAVSALLAWRKADRLASTYGWRWLETIVGADGRVRGQWQSADGGAGRMTATAGLHSLPAELRAMVRAVPGQTLVRADLGQVEPRVLAAISGDEALVRATGDTDMYAPVASRLGCDRPTAKVALLAAMYGQTSGAAGDAMRSMERAYPTAVEFLRTAEAAGRDHVDLRTYGGRLIRLSDYPQNAASEPVSGSVAASHGRFARNAAVQGPAAELFKAWAATVSDGLRGLGGEIVLCLHDELLVQVPDAAARDAVALMHHALASTVRWWAAGTPVRFVAEVAVGRDWASAH